MGLQVGLGIGGGKRSEPIVQAIHQRDGFAYPRAGKMVSELTSSFYVVSKMNCAFYVVL